jgi:hypothetical protein
MTEPLILDLVDAEAMARDNPQTFIVPEAARLDAVRPGWYLRVCRNNERFWVIVNRIQNGAFVGGIANRLVFADNLSFNMGTVIRVERRHVYAVLSASEAG